MQYISSGLVPEKSPLNRKRCAKYAIAPIYRPAKRASQPFRRMPTEVLATAVDPSKTKPSPQPCYQTTGTAPEAVETMTYKKPLELRIPSGLELWHDEIANPREGPTTQHKSASGPLSGQQLEALQHNQWEASFHAPLSIPDLWTILRSEALDISTAEPSLASLVNSTVTANVSLQHSLAFLLANKLSNQALRRTQLLQLFQEAYSEDPQLILSSAADLQAVKYRDPACMHFIQAMLFFKGFQALQCHRLGNWMWRRGRRSLAHALSNRTSEVFGVDVHPGATLGRGVMMDHASGIVIGETAVVGDNVSMLHHVTLGSSSGTGSGARHPTIGNGVLLGAGVSVLGPVVVGHSSKIGAGSVVIADVPANCVAIGVPARVAKRLEEEQKLDLMDHGYEYVLDYVI